MFDNRELRYMMKLSKETLQILKNFSTINSNLMLSKGNKISTISTHRTVIGETTVAETFPNDFGIYDLNEFLGTLSLFEDPELDFTSTHVVVSHKNMSVKYVSADPSILVTPKSKFNFPVADVEFTLSANDLNMVNKTSSVLGAGDVCFVGDGSVMKLVVKDKKNPTGNTFEHIVGETPAIFQFNMRIENFKMLPGNYDVAISSRNISKFSSTTSDLTYYVAVEADSKFSG
jgi:hypothetical protein